MGTLAGRTFALVANGTATAFLAFFAFGPSLYGSAVRVLLGVAALGAALGTVVSFVKLKDALRRRS